MSRPIKQGLDYFPMDVNTDEKLEMVEAKHGLEGFAIVIKLFQKIYREGFYISWNEEKALIFKKNINSELTIVNDVINTCFDCNILNRELFDEFHILTSSGIQKRYFTACKKRKNVFSESKYVIVDLIEINSE